MEAERWPRFGIFAGLWAFAVIYWTLQGYVMLARAGRPASPGLILAGEILYAGLWIALTPLILRLGKRFPLDGAPRWRNAAIHAAASFVFSGTQRLALVFIGRLFLPWYQEMPVSKLLFSPIHYDYGAFLYWITLLISIGIDYYTRFREQELRAARLETQLAQTQLEAIKMQLHPHFLFNTLNTISALVQEDPDAAERMIARLSELLRLSLDNAGAQTTSLRQELDFVRRYLDIEQIRFQDRLEVHYRIAPETLDATVPNLVLQPLVENAIHHGIAPLRRGAVVEIEAAHAEGMLTLRVADNGAGLGEAAADGVGLSVTRARLEGLYGKEHAFHLRAREGGGAEAVLRVPFREEAGPAARPKTPGGERVPAAKHAPAANPA
jgi:two-component sensor histidine kinase